MQHHLHGGGIPIGSGPVVMQERFNLEQQWAMPSVTSLMMKTRMAFLGTTQKRNKDYQKEKDNE